MLGYYKIFSSLAIKLRLYYYEVEKYKKSEQKLFLIKPEKTTPFDRKTALEKKLTEKLIALAHNHTNTHTLM